MGLTIYYTISSRCSPSDATDAVRRFQIDARAMGFTNISDIFDLSADQLKFDRSMLGTNGGCFRLHASVQQLRHAKIRPHRVIGFQCWPGDTEPSCIGLAGYPTTRSSAWYWRWSSFSKTQYASLPDRGGIAHFLEAHKRLIRLLERIRTCGFKTRVRDDGGYWDSRDESLLLANLKKYNELVAAVVGRSGDVLDAHGVQRGIAPIRQHPEFEHLEAKGNADLSKPAP